MECFCYLTRWGSNVNGLTTVYQFYWVNAIQETADTAVENTRLKIIYKTLFPAISPKIKVN
jgi:hypothetical protein